MKTILAVLLFLATFGVAFAQDSGHAARVVDIFGDSISKSDLSKVDGMFSDKAIVYWVDKKLYGKAAILKFLRSQLASFEKHVFSYSPEDGIEDENISTSWGTFGFLYSIPGGQISSQMLGRYSVVAKHVDGKWEIVSLHMSVARGGD